jgi:predicted GH43/DUF377 family glycosyl hydrolase
MEAYRALTRHKSNPIIVPGDVPFECAAVFNSGATMFNGKYLLLLQPEKEYECVGQVPNVVFTCGAVENGDGALNIYYAGADTCMCLAKAKTQDIIDLTREAAAR